MSKFGFQVRQVESGWRWRAFDENGELRQQGVASSRATAAVAVVRALAEGAVGEDRSPRTGR